MSNNDPRKGAPSASSIEQISLCPVSWRAQAGQIEPPSKYAAYGTMMHKHMEDGTTPTNLLDKDAIEWCRDEEERLTTELLPEGGRFVEIRERRLWLGELYSGQADYIAYNGDAGIVIDYKFGRGDVTAADENLQLMTLAVLLKSEMPQLSVVYAVVLQPFVSRVPMVATYDFSQKGAYDEYVAHIADIISRARDASETDYNPSEQACKYCRAKHACPALTGQLATASKLDNLQEQWWAWSPEKKAKAIELAQCAEKFAKHVKGLAKQDIQQGGHVTGWDVGNSSVAYKIHNASVCYKELTNNIPITAEEFASCCEVGITELDKVYHAHRVAQSADKVTQKSSKETLRELLKESGAANISTSEGKLIRNKGGKE